MQNFSKSLVQRSIYRVENATLQPVQEDFLAKEEPLEIRLVYGPATSRKSMSLSVTMRTPGQDFDLVRGFLWTEGIIHQQSDLLTLRYGGVSLAEESQENVVIAELSAAARFEPQQVERHFYTSSSCGVCGKASLDLVRLQSRYSILPQRPIISTQVLQRLPDLLRQKQQLFTRTGGIHAAALFAPDGTLFGFREDVGRHNAMDKIVGMAWQDHLLPVRDHLCLWSGRASFELCQKAFMAGIGVVAAIGAPSSLAVEFAEEYGMTLIGFLRPGGMNVYTGIDRVLVS